MPLSKVQAQVIENIDGGGSDALFFINDQTMTVDYTLAADKNGVTAGPITVNSGITLTVSSGARLVVV
jgi:hypothetical protein